MFTSRTFAVFEGRRDTLSGVGLCALITVGLYLFWAGLTGPFLFDDIRNLEPLGFNGGIRSAADLARFVFSGEAGPLGRPLSLLTFAMNDVGWPSDPWLFKYTNLLIHALNGVLVFVLARQLAGFVRAGQTRALAVALGATAIWLVHPLQLTPVFLVVQRMTQLSALFVFAGLILYLAGRRTAATRPVAGYVLMSLGVGAGGTLAVLSKENGILLPLFIVVIEATLASGAQAAVQRPRRGWRAIFIWLPLALLAAYVLRGLIFSDGGILARRDFSMVQRLLTEARVLMDYLRLVVLPNLSGSGLFHEDYVPSRGLFSPLSTVLSIAVLAASFVAAFVYRRRHPVLAFAVLWFLAGHCLEAGPINLELYFEHRNYLPLLGPAFAGAWYALSAPAAVRRFAVFGLLGFTTLCALATWQASHIWGDFGRLATISAKENPRSIRAQQSAAKYWMEQGNLARAARYLLQARAHHPDNIGLALQIVYLDCTDGRLDAMDMSNLLQAARRSPYTHMVHKVPRQLLEAQILELCEGITVSDIRRIERALLDNPRYQDASSQRRLYYDIAHIYARQGSLGKAIAAADKAYAAAAPAYEIAMQSAAWLASAGDYDRALEYIDKARHTRGENWYERLDGQRKEIDNFEKAVIEARERRQTGAQTGAPPVAGTAAFRSVP